MLIIVSFNIFIVSELSFALNKDLYSHGETPLRKIIHIITYLEDDQIKAEKTRSELECYLGHEVKVNDKKKEQGYWQFVKISFLILVIPHSLAFFQIYYLW